MDKEEILAKNRQDNLEIAEAGLAEAFLLWSTKYGVLMKAQQEETKAHQNLKDAQTKWVTARQKVKHND